MIKRLLKAYLKNVFDGKVTTLIGLALATAGTIQAFRGAEYTTVIELVILGLIVAGFKDPRLGSQPTDQNQKEP